MRKANQVKSHDTARLIQFLILMSNFVNVFRVYKQIGDLQSSSVLYMAVHKLPQIIKENGGSMMTTTRTGLIYSYLENAYQECNSRL